MVTDYYYYISSICKLITIRYVKKIFIYEILTMRMTRREEDWWWTTWSVGEDEDEVIRSASVSSAEPLHTDFEVTWFSVLLTTTTTTTTTNSVCVLIDLKLPLFRTSLLTRQHKVTMATTTYFLLFREIAVGSNFSLVVFGLRPAKFVTSVDILTSLYKRRKSLTEISITKLTVYISDPKQFKH